MLLRIDQEHLNMSQHPRMLNSYVISFLAGYFGVEMVQVFYMYFIL